MLCMCGWLSTKAVKLSEKALLGACLLHELLLTMSFAPCGRMLIGCSQVMKGLKKVPWDMNQKFVPSGLHPKNSVHSQGVYAMGIAASLLELASSPALFEWAWGRGYEVT